MSEVNGSLTYEELLRIRNDNVGYRSDTSLLKVRLFIEATEALLGTPLTETEHAGERIALDPRELRLSLESAIRWQASQTMRSQPLPVFQPADGWRCE
jgi:hypothetical protein